MSRQGNRRRSSGVSPAIKTEVFFGTKSLIEEEKCVANEPVAKKMPDEKSSDVFFGGDVFSSRHSRRSCEQRTNLSMTCAECQKQFSALSVEEIPVSSTPSLRLHLQACPQCREEWVVFETTLLVLSTTTQQIPSAHQSREMWQGCAEHIFVEREKQRQRTAAGWRGWLARQPRWGWVSLASAAAVLASVWFMAPAAPEYSSPSNLNPFVSSPGPLVTFQQPPAIAAGLVNHHSAMAVDPFTDYVGSTMVSYSATAPLPAVAEKIPR